MTKYEQDRLFELKEATTKLDTTTLADPTTRLVFAIMKTEYLWMIDLIERLEAQLQEQLKINQK